MRGGRLFAAMYALTLCFAQPASAQTSDQAVKATFVYRFASFIGWPPAVSSEDLSICVAGADPFARALQRAVAGPNGVRRRFLVRRIQGAGDIDRCNVIYVVGSRTGAVLRAARGRPILTITDSVSGGERGIIHFALVEDRVRFYIDDAQAAESGLSIDPRLLSLALAVRRRPVA